MSAPVITDDMLPPVLRRRANGESVEQIRPNLITPPASARAGTPASCGSYRGLAEHEKRQAYPEAVAQAHADFDALQAEEIQQPQSL